MKNINNYIIEKLYIGKLSVLDSKSQRPIIIDWRAPISNLYYDGRIGKFIISWATSDSEKMGLEKNEVLVRQNGIPTYFAADIAYHRNKLEDRGFDLAINIWGADHHGHIARMKGAMEAVGISGDKLDVLVIQLVSS